MNIRYEYASLINDVLIKICEDYNSPKDETGLVSFASGVYAIEVNNKPKFWFFEGEELIDWLFNYNEGNIRDCRYAQESGQLREHQNVDNG